jgi:hypothetical protein
MVRPFLIVILAEKHPETVERMSAEWHRMTREDLKAPAPEQRPVSSSDTPKNHPEWSDYSGKRGADSSRRKK